MAAKSDEDVLYLEIPLEEMNKTFDRQIAGIDAIKTNVRAVLSAASLIVSLVSTMQLVMVKIEPQWQKIFQCLLAFGIGLYIILIIICIAALWPITIVGPIKADWDILTSSYVNLSRKKALELRLSSILNAIDENSPKVRRLKWLQISAQMLLALLVVLILIMSLIPRS